MSAVYSLNVHVSKLGKCTGVMMATPVLKVVQQNKSAKNVRPRYKIGMLTVAVTEV